MARGLVMARIAPLLASVSPLVRWAITIDDLIDPTPIRTSQRAELLAAINGIRKLGKYEGLPVSKSREGRAKYASRLQQKDAWVIVSDSEYVVSGMTEWVPAWKVSHFPRSRPVSSSDSSEKINGWRNSSKRKPKNLDLFQILDATVDQYEREYDVQIAFWRMGREYNTLADGLAGIAARGQTLEESLQAYVDTASFSPTNHDISLAVRLLPSTLRLSDVSFSTVFVAIIKQAPFSDCRCYSSGSNFAV